MWPFFHRRGVFSVDFPFNGRPIVCPGKKRYTTPHKSAVLKRFYRGVGKEKAGPKQ